MKLVAVEGMTLFYTATLAGSPVSPVSVTATLGPASQSVKVDRSGVYADGLRITATAWTIGAYAGSGTAVAGFSSSAEYVKADGAPVLLEGDYAEFDVQATNPSSGDTRAFTIRATIKAAGQSVLKAD